MKTKFYFLWLSLLCIVFFALQSWIPGLEELMILNLKAVYEHQYWRFVTAIFLHGSVSHLALNLFALLFFGVILENLIGSRKFVVVFFASGIIANAVAVNFYSSSLGASGAIYGIIGCLTVLRPVMMVWAFGMLVPMFVASILWVSADILRIFGLNPGNIGSIAHISGIFIGFLSGVFFRSRFKIKRDSREQKINIPDYYVNSWEERYMR